MGLAPDLIIDLAPDFAPDLASDLPLFFAGLATVLARDGPGSCESSATSSASFAAGRAAIFFEGDFFKVFEVREEAILLGDFDAFAADRPVALLDVCLTI
jgi:hypothetical protein